MTRRDDLGKAADEVERALSCLVPEQVEVRCQPIGGAVEMLFPSERAAIANAIDTRQQEFATGRVLARRALQQIGEEAVEIPVDLRRGPVWPVGVRGSISHSSGLCVVAVAQARDVQALGLDIERVGAVKADIMSSVCHENELRANADLFPEDELNAILFSAREAVFKAYNPATRSYLGHKEVELTLRPASFTATLISPDRPAFYGASTISGHFVFAGGMVLSVVCLPTRLSGMTHQ